MRHLISFFTDAFKIALESIYSHKLRAFLTLIGIIIGVASVVVVGASISGLNSYVLTTVAKLLGVNHFMVDRMVSATHLTEEEWRRRDKRNKKLTWDDYDWLRTQCETCKEVGAETGTSRDLRQGGEELFGTQIMGVTANMGEIEDKDISEGRFLINYEVEHAENVCVIGFDLKEKFFPGATPIGKSIKISDVVMQVVGVEAKRGSFVGQSLDNLAYIPLTTFEKMFGRRRSLQLHGKSEDRERFHATIEQARLAMRNRHKLKGNDEDDFGLVNVDDMNNGVDQFTGAIAAVVVPITCISLLVGGIVVMNIMLVSVTERTFEIGLRKACGARGNHILMQFLIESALLSSVGGILGLLLASGLASLVRATTPVPMTITIPYVVLSIGVSAGVGLIFGIYPAYKASKLDPIRALTKI
ncbi:MAG: ABC transporter permease [Blastocatellia bacterium AA13]|nr:MAG: ABC transporter permease [Blastocatellia bacterium AA13]